VLLRYFNTFKPLCNRPRETQWCFHQVFGKNVTISANFLPGCPFLAFFKNSQMTYAGYVKLNSSASAGEVTFSVGEEKKSTELGFTGPATEIRDN